MQKLDKTHFLGGTLGAVALPLHLRLNHDLIRKIEDGIFRPGDLIPSERDLCTAYGVSSVTVRRALSDLTHEGRIVRQVGVGTFVTSARRRSRLGLVVFGFDEEDWHRHSDIHGDLIGGIAAASWQQDAVFSLIRVPLRTSPAELLESLIAEKLFDAFILRTAGDFVADDVLPLMRAGIPFVLAKRRLTDVEVNCVVVDEVKGGYLATKHLIDLGHRRIAFIGPAGLSVPTQRLEGYSQALREANLPADPALIQIVPAFGQAEGRDAARALLTKERPTAIFASADILAEGAYEACRELAVRIPDDVSIVGHGNLKLASRLQPPLTTVHFSYYDLGVKSADLLLGVVLGSDLDPAPSCEVIDPVLVVRSSAAVTAQGAVRSMLTGGEAE